MFQKFEIDMAVIDCVAVFDVFADVHLAQG